MIGEDRQNKEKLAYFVPLGDVGLGVGAGPVLEKQPRLSSGWQDDRSGSEDSLQAVRNSDSVSNTIIPWLTRLRAIDTCAAHILAMWYPTD